MKRVAIKDYQLQEVDDQEVDYELPSGDRQFGSHAIQIPMPSAVNSTRSFYGARFLNQALPLKDPEAPLVQALSSEDPDGRSWEEIYGKRAGAVRASEPLEILESGPGRIVARAPDGTKREIELYVNQPFNRKSAITNTPVVQKGDKVQPGALLARSNFTDGGGTLALGANVRVGLVPYKGFTMDDAMAISQSLAARMQAVQSHTIQQRRDRNIRGGKGHYASIFPDAFTKAQLERLDPDGVVQPGTILQKGDPIILATAPRVASSADIDIGRLSKTFKSLRQDAAETWDHDEPAQVLDVARTRDGTVKVLLEYAAPLKVGDKVVFRSGHKGTLSHIIPDDHMPRTTDGRALEVLLNPASIPSRTNDAVLFEMLLGKVARKRGAPIKVPAFTPAGTRWIDFVREQLAKEGLPAEEEVFDPIQNIKLKSPIMVGDGFLMKLHHTSESKKSSRGQAAYDVNQQPLRGGDEGAQAKRLGGLEVHALLSAGAYENVREGATLRGQRNDEFWQQVRSGHQPKPPGVPFVWDKFRALLQGAGMNTRDMPKNKIRLGPMTDAILAQHQPIEVQSGDLVELNTLAPVKGGLFDPALSMTNKFGQITLDEPVPNPAFEDSIRILLGLKKAQLRAIMAGTEDLTPEA